MVRRWSREYVVDSGPSNGSYGQVYVAHHEVLETRVAIKRLHPHIRSVVIREEALKQKTVRSPYVVQVLDYWNSRPPAIVMEYCPVGLDSYLIERLAATKQRIPLEEAREILYGVLQGLNDAHRADIIHGDIKPANVRFGVAVAGDGLGLPKLGDFGAARRLREDTLTVRGSTNWMAPETIAGTPATKAADYFSYGILAYLLLTGRHPYFNDDPSCLWSEEDNISSRKFVPLPIRDLRSDIPNPWGDLVMALLSRDEEARVRGERELKTVLGEPQLAAKEPLLPAPPATLQPTVDETAQISAAYDRARQLFFAGYRPDDAIQVLDELFEVIRWKRFEGQGATELADCWSLAGFVHNSRWDFANAVTAANNGLRVAGDHASSLHVRGYARIQLGEYEAAAEDLTRALEVSVDPQKRAQITKLLDTVRVRLVPNGTAAAG